MYYSPDGSVFASGSADRTIKLWDAGQGSVRSILERHCSPIDDIAFSQERERLASACEQDCCVWDVKNGKLRQVLYTKRNYRQLPRFFPDGQMLVYGVIHDQRSNWSDVDVWDVSSGRLLHTVDSMIHCPQAINFSPVGRLFATAALDVTKIWDASLLGTLGKPTDTLKKMFLSRDIQQLAFLTTD